MGLIAPAYNLVPTGLGLGPECMFVVVSFFLSIVSFLSSLLLVFFGCKACTMWACSWYCMVASDMGRYTTVR